MIQKMAKLEGGLRTGISGVVAGDGGRAVSPS